MFERIQKVFLDATTAFRDIPKVYRIHQRENFYSSLVKGNKDCDVIRKGLRALLEKKRGKFPRLFFLSNEELIDIFGRGEELISSMIQGDSQAFVSTMFEGVHRLMFNSSHNIQSIRSKDGEIMSLLKPVLTGCTVDAWLSNFEEQMLNSLKHFFFFAFKEQDDKSMQDWITSWPGQATLLASEVWFTKKIHTIFQAQAERDRQNTIRQHLGS